MAKITIFGMAGTGKTSTGKGVAEKLKYEFFSGGDFARDTAQRLGMTINELDELSETEEKYDIERDKTIEEFGKSNDNFVVEARLGWYFIPDSFKVCFICDFNERVKRIAMREGKDISEVDAETKHRERSIHDRFEKYYGIDDIEDPKHFDLIIDTQSNSLTEVIDLIMREISLRRII